MTAIRERQWAHFSHIQKAKNCETFLYTKGRHFAKIETISVTFLYRKSKTIYVTQFFIKFLKLVFVYKKHDTLRYVTFLYTKIQTLSKNQDNLRYVFIYKNMDTLHYAIFHQIFEIGGGEKTFFYAKKTHFALYFYKQKRMHFALRFIYKKPYTLRYIYICR